MLHATLFRFYIGPLSVGEIVFLSAPAIMSSVRLYISLLCQSTLFHLLLPLVLLLVFFPTSVNCGMAMHWTAEDRRVCAIEVINVRYGHVL